MRQWRGTIRIWVDNDNVVRVLEERSGTERADAVWEVAENWAGGSEEARWNPALTQLEGAVTVGRRC